MEALGHSRRRCPDAARGVEPREDELLSFDNAATGGYATVLTSYQLGKLV
jgi:hypothetical protein